MVVVLPLASVRETVLPTASKPFLALLLLAPVLICPTPALRRSRREASACFRTAAEGRPPAGKGEGLNLPLTISVFNPLTLGRHPAAGRLPFGALAPEVGWFGSFRGDGTSGRTRRRGEGVAPVPERCRCRGRRLGAGREP